MRKSNPMILFGLFAFVGLPLVGWGVVDARAFFGNGARLGYCAVAAVLQAAASSWLPNAGLGAGDGRKIVQRQRVALAIVKIIVVVLLLFAPYCDRRAIAVFSGGEFVRCAGVLVFVAGYLLMLWSTRCLGKQFSVQVTLQADHKLVTDGPYRWARHPRYLGIATFFAGFSLVFRSWGALLLVAALAGVFLWRIHDEEVLLRETFRDEWDAYAGRTRRLVPWIHWPAGRG